VRFLLDTCALLWLAAQPIKLSQAATAAINDSENELFFSDTSVWEIVLKHAAGKLPLSEPPRIWIPKQVAFFRLQPLNISAEALFKSGELPLIHNDPFDRLLAAQALLHGLKFISPDPPFRAFGVDCLW
jgi:PIN domain nuclease of toxin-antitoxin system